MRLYHSLQWLPQEARPSQATKLRAQGPPSEPPSHGRPGQAGGRLEKRRPRRLLVPDPKDVGKWTFVEVHPSLVLPPTPVEELDTPTLGPSRRRPAWVDALKAKKQW